MAGIGEVAGIDESKIEKPPVRFLQPPNGWKVAEESILTQSLFIQHYQQKLEDRLHQWRETGKITAEKLETDIPSAEVITREIDKLKPRLAQNDLKDEKQMLSQALHLEIETSRFYKQMVAELTDEGREMFARFVELEDDHIGIVQAQLDYLSGTGYWFDVKEFDMSGY